MIPVNLIEFNGFIENIFSGNSQYSIWSEMPSHNTPSIGLLVYKYFNLENGFALIVIHFLLLQALLFYALRKDKLDPLTFFSFLKSANIALLLTCNFLKGYSQLI